MADQDVFNAVRNWQASILGVSPNLAFPLGLQVMLGELERITTEVEAANEDRPRAIGSDEDQIDRDLRMWRTRLDFYKAKNGEAKPDDRQAVLWTVTAPLLLGFHGGPTGNEIPLVAGGYPATFDPTSDHPADLATPYSLANQVGVAASFEQENRDRTVQEIKDRAKAVGEGVATYWPYIVGGVVVVGAVGAAIYFGMQARALSGGD